MSAYNGSIELISGLKPAGSGTFPLLRDKDVLMRNGKRLNEVVDDLNRDADACGRYVATRGTIGKSHGDSGWSSFIYSLYDNLPGVKKETLTINGFTNYAYTISTGDYSQDGYFIQRGYSPDTFIKKPKYLLITGDHGIERNAILSVYTFIHDLVNGHNIPDAFKEGVIIKVLPVAYPSAVDAFIYNSDTPSLSTDQSPEAKVIRQWLNSNSDADILIDLHNGNRLNEIAVIVGDSSYDPVRTAKQLSMRGIDRIIPYWKNTIGYPTSVSIADNAQKLNDGSYKILSTKMEPILYSYCASRKLTADAPYGYAQVELSIPSLAIEHNDFYGNYSDYNPSMITPQSASQFQNDTPGMIEGIASGAEVVGNILISVYDTPSGSPKQAVHPLRDPEDDGKVFAAVDGCPTWTILPSAEEVLL